MMVCKSAWRFSSLEHFVTRLLLLLQTRTGLLQQLLCPTSRSFASHVLGGGGLEREANRRWFFRSRLPLELFDWLSCLRDQICHLWHLSEHRLSMA